MFISMHSFMPLMLLCLKLGQKADKWDICHGISATCDLVAGFGHLIRGNVFCCTQLFKSWLMKKLVKIFFSRSLLYKLLFLKKSRIMQSRFARKAPCFIHAHLDIKVNISEVSMELPHPGFGYTNLFSLIFSTIAMRECEVLRDNV